MVFNSYVEKASDPVAVCQPGSAALPRALRILHVLPSIGHGGTEHGVLKLVRGLGEDYFEHRLCAMRSVDVQFARQQGIADKLFVAGGPEPGLQFPLLRLKRIIRTYRPDVVHSRNWGAIESIPAARLARVPVVIHSEHGYELDILAGLPYRRRLLRRALYPMADAVFAVTRDLRSYHARQAWFDSQRIQVIYNGVDTQRFGPRPKARAAVREFLGVGKDTLVIGTVGRLVPIKDHPTLLAAAERLCRQGIQAHVLIVGSGPEEARLRVRAESSPDLAGRVSFVGASDSVPDLLNAMDVFVLPSICEGMSNTLAEAMATAVPVLATRAGGNPELVEEGATGWLFPPGDIEALTTRLKELAGDALLRLRFGEAARRRTVQRFSLERMLECYRDLYLCLADRRGVWRST